MLSNKEIICPNNLLDVARVRQPSTIFPILIKQYDYDKNGNIKGKYVSVI